MNAEKQEAEVITPEVMPKEALQIIEKSGVESSTVTQLREAFNEMFGEAEKWVAKSKDIVVTDVSQTREMKIARDMRLALRQIRCDAENTRKRLKADALAKGKAIDGIANVLKALVEPVEAYLQEQEDFAKRVEEQKREELRQARTLSLSAYMDLTGMSFDFAMMQQEQFDAMLTGAKMKKEAEAAASQKLEQMRIEEEARLRKEAEDKARLEAEQREKERLERERLLKEAQDKAQEEAEKRLEAERKAKAEREKAEREAAEAKDKADAEQAKIQAKLDAERKERERMQAEINAKAKAEREEKEKAEREEAARLDAERIAKQKAEQAPDKDKALAFAATIRALIVPKLSSEKGKEFQKILESQVEGFAKWVETKTATQL